MKAMRVLLVVCLVLALVGVAGCDKIVEKAAQETTEKIIENETGVDIETDEGEVTIEGEDGSSFTASESGELPGDWPEDVPVYEGNIVSTMVSEGSYTASVEAEAPAADVYAWSLEEIKSEGWTVTTEFKDDNGGTLLAAKDDRTVQYTITVDNGASAFIVFTGKKAQ